MKYKSIDACFFTMAISLVAGLILGMLNSAFSLKWLDTICRGLFVVGLVALPLMFFMMARMYWKEKDKKQARFALVFSLLFLGGIIPLIIKICF